MDGLSETVSVSDMTDEQLQAALLGAETDDDTEPATVTTEGEAAPDADATTQADQVETTDAEHPEGWNPEGPGNLKVALQQERQAAAEAKARAERAEAEAAEYRQRQAEFDQQQRQYQQQQQAEQTREQLVERLGYVDGEEAAAIVEQIRQYDAQTFQYQAQAERLGMSAEIMRDAHPDFDEHVKRAYDEYGPALDALALQKNPKNPAQWAYELGKKLDLAASFDTRIADAVQKALPAAVQEVLQKQKPPDTQGHKGIAHVSSETPGKTLTKRASEMTDAELRRELGY